MLTLAHNFRTRHCCVDIFFILTHTDNFPKRSWLRAGVYFVDSLAKTSNGKLVRREITKIAIELFNAAKQSDAEIQSYFSDIPTEFKKIILM